MGLLISAQKVIPDITTPTIADNSLTAAKLKAGLRGWTTTLAFSVVDLNTVQWGSGSIILADGTSYSIAAGNTGNMGARSYLYLDLAVSATALQITTTAGNAVGDLKILVATAAPAAGSGTEATFFVYSGPAKMAIEGADIAAGTVTANEIAANTITASQIAATAIDSMTVTGATIRTAASGARIEITSAGIKVYDSGGNQVAAWGTASGWSGLWISTLLSYGDGTEALVLGAGSGGVSLRVSSTWKFELLAALANIAVPLHFSNAAAPSAPVTGLTLYVESGVLKFVKSDAVAHTVMGSNMINSLGSAAIIDAYANSAKFKIRKGGAGSDPSTSDIVAGEIAVWWDSAGVGLWFNDAGTLRRAALI